MSNPQTPKKAPSNKVLCKREDALVILQRLRDAGHIAYFAGGCVRDELLGITPLDYDIATDAPPARVRELFKNTQAVGAAFGVILVRHRGSIVEVATFRADGKYLDGRHPAAVRFTTAQEDAGRRDFTINGLFLDPVGRQVIDYVEGQSDLRRGIIRAIGDPTARFEEDHLRMLRAVRFAARFGFQVDPETLGAIQKNAPKLAQISPERIADELRAMLRPPTRGRAYELLIETGLLVVLLRHLPNPSETPPQDPGGFFKAVSSDPATKESLSLGAALAALSLDYLMDRNANCDPRELTSQAQTHAVAQAMRRTFKLSNEETDQLAGVMSIASLIEDVPPGVAKMKRFLAKPTSAESRVFLRAFASLGLLSDRINALEAELDLIAAAGDVAPVPLITGDDLTQAGMRPGPIFKRILDAIYDAQLEGRISTGDEAMEIAKRVGAEARAK